MSPRPDLAAASRDAHQALRRVERQQRLVERLHRARGERLTVGALARELRVSGRTVQRDVERLRDAGLPLEVAPGRGGGVSLVPLPSGTVEVRLDVTEVAALVSSLAVLGPTVSESASSAMRALVSAIAADRDGPRSSLP